VLTAGLEAPKIAKTRRKIRRLTRALGTVRELDVTLLLLDELARAEDLSRPALQDVRLHVEGEREKLRGVMLTRLSEVDADKLARRLAGISEAVAADGGQAWRQALATRLLKRAKRLAAAIDQAGQLYAPEHLHQVRIAAKKLRYGLELAADAGVAGSAGLVRTLRRTQDTLGRLHDLQVLQSQVAAAQAAPAGRSTPHAGLAAIAGRIEEQCRLLHGRYVAASPGLHDVSAAVRTDVVRRLTGRTRPLKMSLGRASKAAGASR
jgi:CHAD domain-containing protein